MSITTVWSAHGSPDDLSDFGYAWFRLLRLGLKERWFSRDLYQALPGGLGSVKTGLINISDRKANAIKYVYYISENKGVSY